MKRAGFTLIEILLVVVIISALAAMIVPRLTGRSEKARENIARTDVMANLPTALKLYELDNGTVGEIDKHVCKFRVVPVRNDSV